MQTKVLLSIRPRFAEQIFAGLKRYEFRRVLFRSTCVSKILVYASHPVQRVVGEFEVAGILALDARELWKKTGRHSGVQKQYFDEYFEGRNIAYAIEISFPRKYTEPAKLEQLFNFSRPPQSFRYVK
jgi:predicted transcriptional regulator